MEGRILLAIMFIALFAGGSIISDSAYALIPSTTTISLSKGWNLVSAPYSDFAIAKSENSDGADCDMQTIKPIYHYDPTSEKYIKIDALEKMTAGQGYWIYSASACAIEFSGMDYVDYNGFELKKGWNQIGGAELFNIGDYKGSCVFGKIVGYDSFAAEKKYYEADFLEPGKAYWVYANSGCKLAEPKPKAILAVADKSAFTIEEKKFYDELKTYSDPGLMNIEDTANEEIAYPAFVADYYAGSGTNIVTGAITDEARAKADEAAKRLSSSGKDVIFAGNAKQYKQQASKEQAVYKKSTIPSYDLATGANPRLISMTTGFEKPSEQSFTKFIDNIDGFKIPRNGIIRDEYGNIYLIFTYYTNKRTVPGEIADEDGDAIDITQPYSIVGGQLIQPTVRLTGIGIAFSRDNGKTWKYLGSSKSPEPKKSEIITIKATTWSYTSPANMPLPEGTPRTATGNYDDNRKNCKKQWDSHKEYLKKQAESEYATTGPLTRGDSKFKDYIDLYNKFLLTEKYEKNKCDNINTYRFLEVDDIETRFHGITSAENSVYVFYSVYNVRYRAPLSSINYYDQKTNDQLSDYEIYKILSKTYELRAIKITANGIDDYIVRDNIPLPDHMLSSVERDMDYDGINEKIIMGYVSARAIVMKFIGYSKNRQYFVENEKLFVSEDWGRTLNEIGSAMAVGADGNSYEITNILESSNNIFGILGGKIYILKDKKFEQVKPINAKKPIPVSSVQNMVFDSQDNLHVYAGNKYYFRTAKELAGSEEQLYDSIEVVSGEQCNDCNAFKKFLRNAGIVFSETNTKGSDLVVNIKKAGKEYSFTNPSALDIAREAGFAFEEDAGYYVGDNVNNGVVYFGLDSNEKPFAIVQKDDGFYKKTYNGKTMPFVSGSYWAEEKILPVAAKSFAGINSGSGNSIDIVLENPKTTLVDSKTYKYTAKTYKTFNSGYPYFDARYDKAIEEKELGPDNYFVYNYDLYTTKELQSDTSSTSTASQLIPGAVLYAPIEEGEAPGKVEGGLAKYVVEEKEVVEDGKKYYQVKVDLRKKINAVDGNIASETITGSAQIGARTADFVVSIINTPLMVFDPAAKENTIDISQEAAMAFDGSWTVVNNLAVENTVCGIKMDANSYQTFTANLIKEKGYEPCFSGIESDIYDAMSCEDWEDTLFRLKAENIIAWDNSFLLESDGEKNNLDEYRNRKFYRAIGIDTETRDNIECKPDVAGKYMALLEFNGDTMADGFDEVVYNPTIQIIATG
ncbi:MAG: hypothetical protein HZB65_03030 [Candidatus Aenigmarchaeota archaeon]|nr:hypothetical protein [Candidatus Aenigmarchaeota archaeon]